MARISDECVDLAQQIVERAKHLCNALKLRQMDAVNIDSLKLERLVEEFREAWER
jgi:hypothetical protein